MKWNKKQQKKTGRQRQEAVRYARQLYVAYLLAAGFTQAEVVETMGASQPIVAKLYADLKGKLFAYLPEGMSKLATAAIVMGAIEQGLAE